MPSVGHLTMPWKKSTRPLPYEEADRILREDHHVPLHCRRTMLRAAFEARPVTTPDGETQLTYDGEQCGYVFKTRTYPT
jgi:hypothetical protein